MIKPEDPSLVGAVSASSTATTIPIPTDEDATPNRYPTAGDGSDGQGPASDPDDEEASEDPDADGGKSDGKDDPPQK